MSDNKKEQTFSNDNVEISCTFRPGCIIDMNVKVSPEATQASYEKAIREIKKQASLPGFRKGKLSKELIIQHFGDRVQGQFKETLLSTAFEEAIQLNQRRPFSRRSMLKCTVKDPSKENGATLHFEYEASPQVPNIDPKALNLTKIDPVPPSQEEFDEAYQRFILMFSTKKPVTDKAVEKGDIIVVKFVNDNVDQKRHFYLFEKLAPKWLLPEVIGMNIGDSKEIEIPAEKENTEAEKVTITIEKLFTCDVPEENDELAQKAGVENIEALKEKVRKELEQESEEAAFDRMRRQVRNELIRGYAFDLPQSLVESETQARFQPFWEATQKSNPTMDREASRKEFLDEVKRHFTCFFLLQPLSSKIDMSYSQEEIMRELNRQLHEVPAAQCVLFPHLEEKEVVDRLLANIIVRNCIDYCIEESLGLKSPATLRAQEQSQEPPQTQEEPASISSESAE